MLVCLLAQNQLRSPIHMAEATQELVMHGKNVIHLSPIKLCSFPLYRGKSQPWELPEQL